MQMKNILKILLLIIFTQTGFAQKLNLNLVSKTTELNFFETKMRGIECEGIIYFVESDLQHVSAYKNSKKIWRTNVISVCGKPSVGEPEIRYIKFEKDKLIIVYGKHSFAEVDIVSGKAKFWGSD
jgi:hypothetical protein